MKRIFKHPTKGYTMRCSGCNKILKREPEFSSLERLAATGEIDLPPTFCNTCAHGKSPIKLLKLTVKSHYAK